MIGKGADEMMPVTSNIRKKLDKLKQIWKDENIFHWEIYTLMLNYIKERTLKSQTFSRTYHPIEEERRFLESFKIIIEGGWKLSEEDFYDLLDVIKFSEHDPEDWS